MTVTDTMVSAIAAGGGMGGVAALITALRPAASSQPEAVPAPGRPVAARRYPHSPPASVAERPAEADHQVIWSLIPAACALLIAGALVTVIGSSPASLSQSPVVALTAASAACAALAIWACGRLLRYGVGQGRIDLALYGAAGLVLAFSALIATLIAGST